MIQVKPAQKKKLQEKILSRYKDNARDLPRRRTKDPYKILVSEIMLQQTQVERVKIKYKQWLERFPSVIDAADATQVEILTMWSWLGFNRRGINLRRAAKEITTTYKGKVPTTEKELLSLPWVWLYTAHAVMAFALNREVPVLDINVKRVLITELWLDTSISDKELREIALTLVPVGQSRDWHNALMDYGALVVTSRKTWIRSAPQSQFVGSTRWVRGNVLKFLVKYGKGKITDMRQKYPHEQFDAIIEWMIKEKIISKKNGFLKLVS